MVNDFNPLRNFNQGFDAASRRREAGLEKSEAERLRAQRESFVNAKNKGQALKQLIIDQPKIGLAFMSKMQTDERGLDALIEDSVMIKHQLEIDPTGASAMALLQNRKQVIDSGALGGNRNSFQTDQAISVLQNEGPQKLHENMSMFIDIPNQLKGQKGVSVQSSKILEDGSVIEVLKGGGRQVISTTGEILTGEAARDAVKVSRDQAFNRKKELARLSQTIRREEAREGLLTDQQKGIQRGNIQRLGELSKTSASRLASIKKATKFKMALDKGEVQSGAGRIGASFIPGVFTKQAQFDEEFNAFAEIAARQALKASGETRPTDPDVEGMKRAMFGIGRDEQVNITLLNDFISAQNQDTGELDQLISASKDGSLGGFTFTPSQGAITDIGSLSDEDLFK